jgi:hypothetical protein
MAKEQKRGNKEVRKPKQAKPAAGAVAQAPAKGSLFPPNAAPKKKR